MNMIQANLNQTLKGKYRNAEKGFSLLEVMIAVCVLSIGLLAIASMQLGTVNANTQAIGVSEAVVIAEFQMETLLSLQYGFDRNNDNKNHAELQETSLVFDPSDGGGFGLNNPFPVNSFIFDPGNINLANPALSTYPPDHWRIEGDYTVMWNISTDAEIVNTKTVQVLVAWDNNGAGGIVSIRRVIPRII